MKIVVLGAGVVGVATAWYLAREGHEVTVVDRQDDVGAETSFANAGMLSFDYSTPWAAPGVPLKVFRWLAQDISPLYLNVREFDGNTLSFLGRMLGECSGHRFFINKSRMLSVARYSARCFSEIRAELKLAYDGGQGGTLELFRTEREFHAARSDIEVLERHNIRHQILEGDECARYEPALAKVREKFFGALRLPGDETGDCLLFTRALSQSCKSLGVQFVMGSEIRKISVSGDRVEGIVTSEGDIRADQYVVALGAYSPFVLNPIGVKVPVYPFKGYSLTVPVLDEERAPLSTVMDQRYKVAVTRLGNRIRVGGIAEIASYNTLLNEKRREAIAFSLKDLFAGAGDLDNADFWTGLRPMTPDSVPVIGGTRYSNLVLNTGHGTLGWTMSLGSARVIADFLASRNSPVSFADVSLARFANR